MELLYLWVEDYKNIHNQGFNFSPRFNCNYDPDTKALTIDDNDDYIENFFGDNINVTAIVGKNGSGKSSVIKLIFYLLHANHFIRGNSFSSGMKEALLPFINKELFLVIFEDNSFKVISIQKLLKKLHQNYSNEPLFADYDKDKKILLINNENSDAVENNINFYSSHFNYMIDTLFDYSAEDNWIKSIYFKIDKNLPLSFEPYKAVQIKYEDIFDKNQKNILAYYNNAKDSKALTNFFSPTNILIKYKRVSSIDEILNCYEYEDFTYLVTNMFYEQKDKFIVLNDDELCNVISKIQKLYKDNKFKEINLLYIYLECLGFNNRRHLYDTEHVDLLNEDVLSKINKWASELTKADDLLNTDSIDLSKIIKHNNGRPEIDKIEKAINFAENNNLEKFLEENGFKKFSLEEIKPFFNFIPYWIDIEWFDQDKSIKSLSSGEKTVLTFLLDILSKIREIEKNSRFNTINIFLDECELGYHPQWQKYYLRQILDNIERYVSNQFKINLIFLTHSPFLLSDIPKQNIIFLDKDEKGNCQVVDGLKEKKQTFGANIHTLLSDSFFMEDGLMGEFAKGKIDKAITLLNQEHLSDEDLKYCEQIISIIGEPIVKNQLQRMLDSKRLEKIDEIDKLYDEIELIKHRIEIMRKNQ